MASRVLKTACAGYLCIAVLLFLNSGALAFDKRASVALSHYILGQIYEDTLNIDSAIQEYKQAQRLDKENSLIYLSLASSYIKKNDIPRAIEALKLAEKLDPEAIEPHAILALLYSSQDKPDLAASEYEKALKGSSKLQPKNVEIYKSLGAVYLQQKRFEDAKQAYKLILDLAPDDAEAHFYLGSIHNELKDNELSKKELRRAIELKPDYHQALNFLGYVYVEENSNLDEAEGMIKKALELEPNNGAYIDSLGWLYYKKANYKEALKELERASALVEDPVIFDHLGDAYFKLEEPQKAKENWQKSLKLDAKQENVKKKLEGTNAI